MKTIWMNVALCAGCEDPDGAEGLWEITLDQDYPDELAVGAAKDVFHDSVAIEVLDDFDIAVLGPQSREVLVEPDDYERCGAGGDVERIGDALTL